MIITHNLQYPPDPTGSTSYWSNGTQLSSNVGVPAGCPFTYATQVGTYDFRIASNSNWFPSRLPGFVLLEVSGYLIAKDSTQSNNMSMFIRYGTIYSNTAPNGYDGSQALAFAPSAYATWKPFKVAVTGTIPANGTGSVSVNMNANSPGTEWWIAGLSIRKLQ